MTQENQAAEQQPEELTPEQVVAQINAWREAIVRSAVDNQLSFDVVFNALSQAAASFMFDFLLLTTGELTDDGLAEAVERFNQQTINTSKVGLANIREHEARVQQDAQVEDVTPKTITEA